MAPRTDYFRSSLSVEQVARREDLIIRQATNLLAFMREFPHESVPYGLIYGTLNWPWCHRFAPSGSNEPFRWFRYYSLAAQDAIRLGEGKLTRDHIIPWKVARDVALGLADLSPAAVRNFLSRFAEVCVITPEEDRCLTAHGLKDRMPTGWDRATGDPFERYRAAGIAWTENAHR